MGVPQIGHHTTHRQARKWLTKIARKYSWFPMKPTDKFSNQTRAVPARYKGNPLKSIGANFMGWKILIMTKKCEQLVEEEGLGMLCKVGGT
jgi:hypothetical protein